MPKGFYNTGGKIATPSFFRYDTHILDLETDTELNEDAYDLCQRIVAGKGCVLHPDAASNDLDPLSLLPPRYRRERDPEKHYNRVDHNSHGEPQQHVEYYRPLHYPEVEVSDDDDIELLYAVVEEEALSEQDWLTRYIERRYGPQ